ncbi:alkene reductase [Halobacteriovorax marinus]|uniref:Alkene reductase n=1 Tax=Halobacteriovorax marinus TaxID=97084 RepID=A0A1Y5F5B2_9BACT|nr:alkene reductase [Halobacteriovorax marinus]
MKLLEEYRLNAKVSLKNRIVMAPLTRSFADDNLVPTEEISNYYEKRADAGLIITEATMISRSAQGYPNTPGIYSKEQIAGWKKTTSKVHAKGGKIFLQIWHVGRVSHPIYLDGQPAVAPSAVKLEGRVPRADDLQYETPRALETHEVESIIEDFRTAALNAIEAGFDGVEIHGANGYLIDQFLHQHTNKRNDKFGGSLENRSRFLLQIVDAVTKAIGVERTGLRLSPGAYFNMEHTKGDELTFKFILNMLNDKNLAYLHTGIFDDSMSFDYLGGTATEFLRENYSGTVIASGGYNSDKGEQDIHLNKFDLLAIGRPFIANPDYVAKVKGNIELTAYDESMLGSLV